MPVGPHNLARLADDAFERHGDHPSVLFEGRWYGSGELTERVHRLAGGFVELGVRPGDRVVVVMANSIELALTYQALWRAGAVITPAIFLLPPDELRHVVSDAEAAAVITSAEFLPTVRTAVDALPSVNAIVSTGRDEPGVTPFADLERAAPHGIVPRADHELAAVMYTGGTTGRAKGVMLSHENLWLAGRSTQRMGDVEGVTRTISSLPLSHGYGLVVTVAALHVTEPHDAVLMRWFEPGAWVELVERHRVHRGLAVPTMLQLLLQLPLEERDLSSLRIINCGSAPLAEEVALEFERRVPSVAVLEGYGLTETAAILSQNPPGRRTLGSVGVPMAGYEVAILDDDGRVLPPREVGEVCCRGRAIMQGYWRAPKATAAAVRDGWLRTGDLGYLDESGYIFIVDRKKDLIIRSGHNVFPRDVEDVLLDHPAVAFAGVVGRPDPVRGEEVVAFVSFAPGMEAAPEELAAHVRARRSPYEVPREVRVVDAIPLTPIGKVDRKALRALL